MFTEEKARGARLSRFAERQLGGDGDTCTNIDKEILEGTGEVIELFLELVSVEPGEFQVTGSQDRGMLRFMSYFNKGQRPEDILFPQGQEGDSPLGCLSDHVTASFVDEIGVLCVGPPLDNQIADVLRFREAIYPQRKTYRLLCYPIKPSGKTEDKAAELRRKP